MSRHAVIPINLCLLRKVLGLPEHLIIDGVTQTPADKRDGTMRVHVSGRLCPEVSDNAAAPELSVVYSRVETGQAHLLSIHGLDT